MKRAPSGVSATPVAALSPAPTPLPTPAPFSATIFQGMNPACQSARVPVLMFHDVLKERGRGAQFFDCTVDELKEILEFLDAQGAKYISLEQLHRHLVTGEPLPAGAVVLTFDDNYQGFYDNAYPILKERQIPSAMFVHTDFVGVKAKGDKRAHMDWDTLRALDKAGLVTIASHTLSHPEDMAKLPIEDQDRELSESKAILERELGHPVPYFAYPSGTGDASTYAGAQQVGYTMAFTMHNGPAEESPSVLTVNRYIHTRYKKAWEECQAAAKNAPAAVFSTPLSATPVRLTVESFEGVKLAMVRGGSPVSVRSPEHDRKSVGEFVRDFNGVAGMNGTFFANAALRGTDNSMIGPLRTRGENVFYPDEELSRLPRLLNRPLVIWGEKTLAIVPFNPGAMSDEISARLLVPDATDIFLGGAWIVHDGVARDKSEMQAYSARDFNDPRKRAFFGVMDNGDIVLGATIDVVTTEMMAKAAAAAGVREAVLMDSGFSTSIVFDGKIIATGHSAENLASRVVPHAIVLSGTIEAPTDPATLAAFQKAKPAVGNISAAEAQANAPRPGDTPKRRRKRR